jgi:hypothetical protein
MVRRWLNAMAKAMIGSRSLLTYLRCILVVTKRCMAGESIIS